MEGIESIGAIAIIILCFGVFIISLPILFSLLNIAIETAVDYVKTKRDNKLLRNYEDLIEVYSYFLLFFISLGASITLLIFLILAISKLL